MPFVIDINQLTAPQNAIYEKKNDLREFMQNRRSRYIHNMAHNTPNILTRRLAPIPNIRPEIRTNIDRGVLICMNVKQTAASLVRFRRTDSRRVGHVDGDIRKLRIALAGIGGADDVFEDFRDDSFV